MESSMSIELSPPVQQHEEKHLAQLVVLTRTESREAADMEDTAQSTPLTTLHTADTDVHFLQAADITNSNEAVVTSAATDANTDSCGLEVHETSATQINLNNNSSNDLLDNSIPEKPEFSHNSGKNEPESNDGVSSCKRRADSALARKTPEKSTPAKDRTDGGSNELLSVFTRLRGSPAAQSDETGSAKSIKDYEQRLAEEKRRHLQSKTNIVDGQLNQVLLSRRKRVDSQLDETEFDEAGSPVATLNFFEQRIEEERKKQLAKHQSDNIADEQLSQLMRLRRERVAQMESPDTVGRKSVMEKRDSFRSATPRSTDRRKGSDSFKSTPTGVIEQEGKCRTPASRLGSLGCSVDSSERLSRQPISRPELRSPVSPGSSGSINGGSPFGKRSLRPLRSVLRKENTFDAGASSAKASPMDPELAALLKLRKVVTTQELGSAELAVNHGCRVGKLRHLLDTVESGVSDRTKRRSHTQPLTVLELEEAQQSIDAASNPVNPEVSGKSVDLAKSDSSTKTLAPATADVHRSTASIEGERSCVTGVNLSTSSDTSQTAEISTSRCTETHNSGQQPVADDRPVISHSDSRTDRLETKENMSMMENDLSLLDVNANGKEISSNGAVQLTENDATIESTNADRKGKLIETEPSSCDLPGAGLSTGDVTHISAENKEKVCVTASTNDNIELDLMSKQSELTVGHSANDSALETPVLASVKNTADTATVESGKSGNSVQDVKVDMYKRESDKPEADNSASAAGAKLEKCSPRVSTCVKSVNGSEDAASASDEDLLSELGGSAKRNRSLSRKKALSQKEAGPRDSRVEVHCVATGSNAAAGSDSSVPEVVRRHTQPVTFGEQQQAKTTKQLDLPSFAKTSIADRLTALQKNGEDGWRMRTKTQSPSSTGSPSSRPVSIVDRVSQLAGAQQTWKVKVEDKDAKQFTVEEKLSRGGKVVDSPLLRTPRRIPQRRTDKDSESGDTSGSSSSRSSPQKTTAAQQNESANAGAAETSAAANQLSPPVRVEVPRLDDDTLSTFFGNKSAVSPPPDDEKIEASIDTFNDIFIDSNDILPIVRRIKPKRTKAGPQNPLRSMAQRTDLRDEYVEQLTGVAEKVLSRSRREAVVGTPQLAKEALAGLASKENYSSVALRKVDSFGRAGNFQPYTDVMLLHVKGRRYCQTRLVAPVVESVNSGDCFVLVTADSVCLWIGEYSNIIERAKGSEVAAQIHQRHDLGTRTTSELVTINEERQMTSRSALKFWKTLGANEVCSPQAPGNAEEDEVYEEYMCETNIVYTVSGDQLVKSDVYCGKTLKYEMLRSKDSYVFDFGSEMYVWTGKHVPLVDRKHLQTLAYELYQKGYDYSEFTINPLCPLAPEDAGGLKMCATERPKWSVFGKVSQNMETVPFREKFIDWPDASRLIRVKGQNGNSKNCSSSSSVNTFDAELIADVDTTPVTLLLEGSHVGHGERWLDFEDGIRREYDIITQSVDVWHVSEFTRRSLEPASYGQFHDEDAYVVCWHYAITQVTHTLGGRDSRQLSTGRSRCVYFFWQGRHCGVGEKGTSALMTVELDKEKGPQVPVVEGKEPPCFVRLFDGDMVVHAGRRDDQVDTRWRLYTVRNELPTEAYLWELPAEGCNLRSRGSFVLVDCHQGALYVWHGCKASAYTQDRAKEIAARLVERCPAELRLQTTKDVSLTEMTEGRECKEFLEAMGGKSYAAYDSLLLDTRQYDYTPRLIFMSTASGTFEATEVLNPARLTGGVDEPDDVHSPFPFLQVDLYHATQPALFLVDNQFEVYLWVGWWPSVDTDNIENAVAGSAEARFTLARRCAMETVLDYCSVRYPSDSPPAYIVNAGREPLRFTNLFPYWQIDEAVAACVGNLAPPEDLNDLELVEDALAKLTEVRVYRWAELQERPLPEGVDAERLEIHLADEELEELLGMPRDEFNAMPTWKQTKLKKDVGLF